MDESRLVLDVGRDTSFVRKIKARQKMDARGVCMLCVMSVNSSGWLGSPPLIREGVFQTNGRFQFKRLQRDHKKRKKERTRRRGPKRQDTKQTDTNTQKDTAKDMWGCYHLPVPLLKWHKPAGRPHITSPP